MKKQSQVTEQTKENFVDAFWQLYCEKELRKITVKDITNRAGYNRSTFYQYFTDVGDLLNQFEESLIGYVVENLEKDLHLDLWRDTVSNIAKVYESKGAYLGKLLGEDGDPMFVGKVKAAIRPMVVGKFNITNIDSRKELVFEFALAGILAVVTAWNNQEKPIPAKEMVSLIQAMLMKGVAPQFQPQLSEHDLKERADDFKAGRNIVTHKTSR